MFLICKFCKESFEDENDKKILRQKILLHLILEHAKETEKSVIKQNPFSYFTKV